MSETTNSWCPVCLIPAYIIGNGLQGYDVECPSCGKYTSYEQDTDAFTFSPDERTNASGYIRENHDFRLLDSNAVTFLKSLATPTVGQKAEKLLRAIAKEYPVAGKIITIPAEIDRWIKKYQLGPLTKGYGPFSVTLRDAKETLSMLSYGWAQNEAELNYLLFDYLVESSGYMVGQRREMQAAGYNPALIRISPSGWEFIQSTPLGGSDIGFVAMWFNHDLDHVYEQAIYPAIEAAGYKPFRIDKKEHNNRIDDEIIAAVRSCRFLIADFTGSRGGVYYEAGFAGGLNKPVIWTVRDDHLSEVHFDTRQYNHIVWDADNLAAFRDALQNRILATIGEGPNK